MILRKIYEIGKTHIVDSTAALVSTNPIFAVFENAVWGMSDQVSLKARLFATGITYAGVGSLLSRGRDFSRKVFKIKDTTTEKIQTFHDAAYLIGFNAILAPIMYSTAGANTQEIIEGTLTAMALSIINGPLIGYAIDAGRDLTGIKKSERMPKLVSNFSSRHKKNLALILIAGLIALNGTIYKITPDKQEDPQKSNIEERVLE